MSAIRPIALVIALAAALALATVNPASAFASTGGTTLPVRGNGTGTLSVNTKPGPDFGKLVGTESGVSSQIGKYTARLAGQGTLSADKTVEGSGTVTILVANGDELRGSFTTTGQADRQTTEVTISGGTGRFANASGTLTVICVVVGDPRQDGYLLVFERECTVTGEISF